MATEGAPALIYEKDDRGVARITLNRPDVHNALNLAMRDLLWTALEALRDDPDVYVGLFCGAGDRAFSAGADISEFGTAPSIIEARRAREERDVWGLMLSITKPLVASIHGFAYGAGCELALCCDLRIAADDATFALPEVKLGYMPSAGGTQTLPRTVRSGIAREMIFTGEPIEAQRALDCGLVQRVVPRERLRDETELVVQRLLEMPQPALRAAKEAMMRGASLPLDAALHVESLIARRLRDEGA